MKLRWIAAPLASLAIGMGCAASTAPSPFKPDAGHEGGAGGSGIGGNGGSGAGESDAGVDVDPTLGGPCLDDGQCDDGFDCTFDFCDLTIEHCRFTPDDTLCYNGIYCDGLEKCDNKLGCRAGDPIGCDDKNACTIDHCDEDTHACGHAPRDVDGDGDPDNHCGGADCDDNDPNISTLTQEVCGNGKDDNCNAQLDEAGCASPAHDTCVDRLAISAPGTYPMTTVASGFDYPMSCGLTAAQGAKDVVAEIHLPPGPLLDVEVVAKTLGVPVSAAMGTECGNLATELVCGKAFFSPQGGQFAKIRARGVGSPTEETVYPLYVATAPAYPLTVDVQFLPPLPKPTNETCGTATPITPAVPMQVEVLDATKDLPSACGTQIGDLVFEFDVVTVSDVDVYAASIDGDGQPSISLRGPGCALLADELTCQTATAPHVFRHSVQPGTYYVSVSATAPTTMNVTVEVSPPSPLPPDELCAGAPVLVHNKTIDVSLAGHQDDINLNCFPGLVDAAYTLDLAVPSDVLLVERISNGDTGALQLALPGCTGFADQLMCAVGAPSPVRGVKHNLAAGSYRAVVETLQAQPTQLTAFVRPAVPPTLVPFADSCADAFTIPDTGGFFQGTTGNATADYDVGCDQGGVAPKGAPDQLLKLVLAAPKRVVLHMGGSAYNTVIDVRKGPACPGVEVPLGCAVGYPPFYSYLDLSLGAGTYFIQIDGFVLDQGPWSLDVFVVDP